MESKWSLKVGSLRILKMWISIGRYSLFTLSLRPPRNSNRNSPQQSGTVRNSPKNVVHLPPTSRQNPGSGGGPYYKHNKDTQDPQHAGDPSYLGVGGFLEALQTGPRSFPADPGALSPYTPIRARSVRTGTLSPCRPEHCLPTISMNNRESPENLYET